MGPLAFEAGDHSGRASDVMMPESVALFATCLVDLFYPQVGEATVRLLRRLGLRVAYSEGADLLRPAAFQ